MTAGPIRPTRTRIPVEIVSVVNGYDKLGSARSNGRRLGTIVEKAAPTAANALGSWPSVILFLKKPIADLHDNDPVDDIGA